MVDWTAIAALLAEQGDRPIAAINRLGRVVLVNTLWEKAFRCRRYEIIDQPLIEVFAPGDKVDQMRQWLLQAWRGTIRQAESELVASDGRRLAVVFDIARVGSGSGQSLLLSIESLVEVHLVASMVGPDVDYKISATVSGFGVIQEVAYVGRAIPPESQQTCFQMFHRRSNPCPDCPVLAEPTRGWPRTAVRRSAARADAFEVITADVVDDGAVRVSVRVISDRALEAIQNQRTDTLASRARLTDREREILNHLLIGHSLDDIAATLNLSRRTVKFHQGNILQKLGADSRTDLIRLFSF